ncbi:MFS transporter [Sulfuracidifex tepidarius]|uniref:Major facilitator superfamily (MFS) profile domain-containing protein n=1 Tax=Sulfuracidifex tepidarius TaxID=1294262 RepID=A0A510E605_9CREN|nr:MFS transporter [Sulfuracidifex tepidarius]BBG27939.1 hypothetical protein IC007_2494 [Sulfuracidifex tepidarius]
MDINFTRLWMARNLLRTSNLGFSIFFMWEIIVIYHSVFLVSLLPALSLVGYLILTLPLGYVLDKISKSKIMFLFSILTFVIYATLVLFQSLYLIYGVDLLSFMLYMGSGDAYYSSIKELVTENELPKAMSFNAVGRAASEIAGTIMGGLSAYFVPKFFPVLLVIISLSCVFLSYPIKQDEKNKELFQKTYSYHQVWKVIRLMLPLLLLGLVVNGAFTALDVYSSALFHQILHVSAIYYTLFLLTFSIGAFVGGILGGKVSEKLIDERFISIITSAFGFAFVLIAFLRAPLLESTISFMIGIGISMVNIPLETLMMRVIPKRIMGRTNSLIQVFLMGSSPLMAIFYGFVATLIGIVNVLILVGIFGVLLGIPTFFVIRDFKKVKESDVEKLIQ